MDSQVSFETIKGTKIFQILTEPDSSEKKIVIMSHGFRGSSIGPARTFVDFERLLVQNGFSTLRFDQPCGGNSEGDYVDSSFNEWVQTTTYFAEKYLDLGYKVILLGQSMGATTTMIVAAKEEVKDKIPCILLWVPDPKSTYTNEGNEIGEEGGQKYSESFWQEAKDANFFKCINDYEGGIHLVYGEHDKYISEELRKQVIEEVKKKNQPYLVLPGQDHSSWDFDLAQKVYQEELDFIKNNIKIKEFFPGSRGYSENRWTAARLDTKRP